MYASVTFRSPEISSGKLVSNGVKLYTVARNAERCDIFPCHSVNNRSYKLSPKPLDKPKTLQAMKLPHTGGAECKVQPSH